MKTTHSKVRVRKSADRGKADFGWLKSYHSFSFGEYYDHEHMGFRSLKVINEDWIAGGEGFGSHPHKDMEIITFVVEGQLSHKDSMGNGAVIYPGDVQKMSAGTGIQHSEFNADEATTAHILQIWITPERNGLMPSYAQTSIRDRMRVEGLALVAAHPQYDKDAVPIYQDAKMYYGHLPREKTLTYHKVASRGVWLQLIKGNLVVNGTDIETGDAVALEEGTSVDLQARAGSKFLLFDLK